MEYLLQLKDGYLLNIESDEESYGGVLLVIMAQSILILLL